MPFGVVFGAVVFVVLCVWYGGDVLGVSDSDARLGRVFLGALGSSLALGLLLRQSWARWMGAAAAALLAAVGLRQVFVRAAVLDHALLLAAMATAVLLLVPATGDVRRGLALGQSRARRLARLLAVTAGASLAGIVLLVAPPMASGRMQEAAEADTLPAAGTPGAGPALRHVSWKAYGPGLERARAEGRFTLVDFYASWCGPCREMDRKTFRDRAVIERLSDLVTVKIDSEDAALKDGYRGMDLAEQYRVSSYPTLVLLDPQGQEVSRRSGFLSPRRLLSWIDREVARRPPPHGVQSAIGLRASGH